MNAYARVHAYTRTRANGTVYTFGSVRENRSDVARLTSNLAAYIYTRARTRVPTRAHVDPSRALELPLAYTIYMYRVIKETADNASRTEGQEGLGANFRFRCIRAEMIYNAV